MIKLVGAGVWVCAVTLASVYFSVQSATAPVPDAEAQKKAQQEYVKGELVNVPVLDNGAVNGYFLAKVSYMVDKTKAKDIQMPLTEMTTDQLYTLLVGNKMIDLGHIKSFDLAGFRAAIQKNLNTRLGGEYIQDVLVEQLDYLSKAEIKATQEAPVKRDMKPKKIVEGTPAPEGAETKDH